MYEISINDQTPHLEVLVDGDVTPQVLESFIVAAAHTSFEYGIYSYLLDLRTAKSSMDVLCRYHAVACRAKDLGFKPGSKLAILTTEYNWQDYLTVAMFVSNHGYYCKTFLNRDDAVSWLW